MLYIVFIIFTTSALNGMEKQDPSIQTINRKEITISRKNAEKIPLINNLINDTATGVESIQFPKESFIDMKSFKFLLNKGSYPIIHSHQKGNIVRSLLKNFKLSYINNQFNHELRFTRFLKYKPNNFKELLYLHKASDYLLFPKDVSERFLRYAYFECPISESDLKIAESIPINKYYKKTIMPYESYDYKSLSYWNLNTFYKLCVCIINIILNNGHTGWVDSIAFSPDGKALASASSDKTVKLWNVTGQCINTLNGHTDWVRSIAFSPDGKILASASSDRTVKLWDAETWKCINTLNGHTDWVTSIAFNPDGKTLASAAWDRLINTYEFKKISTPLTEILQKRLLKNNNSNQPN